MAGPNARDVSLAEDETLPPSAADANLGASIRASAKTDGARYVPLESVGQGGMGTVVRAYDPKLHREVAIKRLRRDSAFAVGEGRLVTEARALARLSHPAVVAVFDVDVLDDEVIIAMEYVSGQSLRRWLDSPSHGWTEIVRVFTVAGEGLAAAHQAGLVHRDVKPDNVIVADTSRRSPLVKVIDFGLAHEHEEASLGGLILDDSALATRGTEFDAGTPRYMAPEQHRRGHVGPAADQYAFCVSLWEALARKYPFAVRAEDLAAAKEVGPPATGLEDVPGEIEQALRRGLSPAPQDRWPSMDALLGALLRGRRAGRRRRRRWLAVGVIALGVAAPFARSADAPCTGGESLIGETWNAGTARRASEAISAVNPIYAEDGWPRAVERLDAYAQTWADQHRDACEATNVDRTQTEAELDLRMTCLHRARIELEALVSGLLRADEKAARRAVVAASELPALDHCSDLEALASSEVRPQSEAKALAVERARESLARASVARDLGHYADALVLAGDAWGVALELEFPPLLAEAARERALAIERTGDLDGALQALRDATRAAFRGGDHDRAVRSLALAAHLLALRKAEHGAALELVAMARQIAISTGVGERGVAAVGHYESIVLLEAGRPVEAEKAAREVLAVKRRLDGGDNLGVAASLNNLGNVLRSLDRLDESIEVQSESLRIKRELLGPLHPDVATALSNLGNSLQQADRNDEAVVLLRDALEILGRLGTGNEWRVAVVKANLANSLMSIGGQQEAVTLFTEAIATAEVQFGPEHVALAKLRGARGYALMQNGEHESALEELERALEMVSAFPHEQRLYGPNLRSNLGLALLAIGRVGGAVEELRRALTGAMLTHGPDHREVAGIRSNLAMALIETGAYEEAEVHAREALRVFEPSRGTDHEVTRAAAVEYGRALLGREADALARSTLERFVPSQSEWASLSSNEARLLFVYARALWGEQGDKKRALRMAEQAGLTLVSDPMSPANYAEVEAWLEVRRASSE